MSNYRKLHITLSPENYQLVRKAAFDAEASISQVIDTLIEETYGSGGEETGEEVAAETQSEGPKQPEQSFEWEIMKIQPWRKG